MGTFLFKWEHPASDVYVTGTFDDWSKSERLDKVGEHFEKNVALRDASKKIYYKFVVDGNWVTDHTAPKEADESGNENNILEPERIVTEPTAATTMLSSAAPDSTTAALAAEVPLEKKDGVPSETPAADAAVEKTEGKGDSSDVPGTFPETPAAEVSVNPLPAAPGAVNPITLAPGEKIPDALSAESTTANVKLDPESYENSDALPGGAPFSAPADGAADAPPEASVPEVVKESQETAHVDPEASAVPEEVEEKAAVEKELLGKVKEAPATSEGTAGKGAEKTENTVTLDKAAASVGAAITATAAAAVGAAVIAKDTIAEKTAEAATAAQNTAAEAATSLPESVKEKLPESVQTAIAGTEKEETREEVSPEVPSEVRESIVEAGTAPEAAANTEAVAEKKAVETELLEEVKPTEAVGESSNAGPSTTETKTEAPATDAKVEKATAEPKAAAPAEGTVATNGGAAAATAPTTPAKPAEVKASGSNGDKPAEAPAKPEKKKRNRLSTIFGKLKSKVSHK